MNAILELYKNFSSSVSLNKAGSSKDGLQG